MPRLIVYGSIGLDTVHTEHGKASEVLGGSASYAAVAASFFVPTGLVAVVGTDFPAEYTERLLKRGVDLAGLERRSGATFRWTARYHTDMNNRDTLDTQLGVMNDTYKPLLPPSYRQAPFVLLANTDPDSQMAVLDQVDKPSFVAADTMNLWIQRTRGSLDRLLGRVDLLILNDSEAQEYTGERNVNRAGSVLLDRGPDTVIIKKGEHGALLFAKGHRGAIPAEALERVVDPTGAGDTFAGALVGYIAETGRHDAETIRRGMAYGAVAASATCCGFSLQGLLELDRNALDQRLRMFLEYARV